MVVADGMMIITMENSKALYIFYLFATTWLVMHRTKMFVDL